MCRKILVLALAAICSCTTTAPTTKLTSVKAEAKTGVIVPLRFTTKDSVLGKSGCEMTVRQAGGLTPLKEIHVVPGTSISFAELEPGVYSYRDFRCGTDSADLTLAWPN